MPVLRHWAVKQLSPSTCDQQASAFNLARQAGAWLSWGRTSDFDVDLIQSNQLVANCGLRLSEADHA